MAAPTIFLIDDQASVRDALAEMLSVFGYAVKTYESADLYLAAIDRPEPGCIVADVRMPGTDGLGLVRELARRNIAMPVVLISGHADVPMAVAAIKSGAEDFIEKPVDDRQLVAAINRAFARSFEQQDLQQSQGAAAARFARLTPRQIEIFDLVVEGFTSHAISARLNISMRTVESYRAEVMQKMQAESIAGLVRQAIRFGNRAQDRHRITTTRSNTNTYIGQRFYRLNTQDAQGRASTDSRILATLARDPVRRQWSASSMALEKIEYGPGRKFAVGGGFRFQDWYGLIAIAAAQLFVLLLLVGPPLAAPVISLLAFVMACGVALYALATHASRDAQGVTIWNIAYACTWIWIVAAVMSKPRHVLDWFDNLAMIP